MSEMTSLALHGMVFIAASGGQTIHVKEIARKIGASEAHLSKVLQRLVKVGLLHSTRGPSGGFEMAKAPERITLWDIYLAMEGSITHEGCPIHQNHCPFTRCILGGIPKKLNQEFEDYLKSQTLQDFPEIR